MPLAAPYRLPQRGWCVLVGSEELGQAVLLRVKGERHPGGAANSPPETEVSQNGLLMVNDG